MNEIVCKMGIKLVINRGALKTRSPIPQGGTKQIQIFEKQINKPFLFETFEHLNFGVVSDFDIRISSFRYSYLVPATPG
jgi:hypothetical protein